MKYFRSPPRMMHGCSPIFHRFHSTVRAKICYGNGGCISRWTELLVLVLRPNTILRSHPGSVASHHQDHNTPSFT
ncbi:hypothetical protein J6590_022840 [Homalodisca vitripennis]|nr:hypothetical protein J6590_022840 [Homalodisca vitripennis]